MAEGRIMKALSGFYYVDDGSGAPPLACKARGRFRHEKITPLVGDFVRFTDLGGGAGVLDELLPRKNQFSRPAVANIDQLVIVAAGVIPVTDPFLIDRVAAIAEASRCEPIVCINKCDLDRAEELYEIYRQVGYQTLRVSAETGEGLDGLSRAIAGKACAFTGNSGVGKSSILNALEPEFSLAVGEVSSRLGRGRHTTRHVELFRLKNGAIVADTPGFSSFDAEQGIGLDKEALPHAFREFRPYLERCRFIGCTHRKEKDCAVLEAVAAGDIPASRHRSYLRLYQELSAKPTWEGKKSDR